MANIIGTKKYLTALVFNKKTRQTEAKIVKADSSNHKIVDNWSNHIESSIRKTNRYEKKS